LFIVLAPLTMPIVDSVGTSSQAKPTVPPFPP